MSLINYIEPVNVGSIFAGIAALIVSIVLVYLLARLFMVILRYFEVLYSREAKYELLEEKFLDDIAMEKGIDLDKELLKRNILRKERKSFRAKIEDEMYNRMFPKEEKETKKK